MSTQSAEPSPYVGLRAFTADEADRFFARERWTRIVVGNVVASRLTLLYGESGVGKTSLLQAGVEHEIRQGNREGSGRRARSRLVPIVFRSWQGEPVTPLIDEIWARTREKSPAPESLTVALRRLAAATGGRVILILDQFEEYLLYHGQSEGPGSLPSQLAQALEEPRLQAAVVVSIREDALSRLDPLKRAVPRLFDNSLHLERVDRHAAAETITGPIGWYNKRFAAGGESVEIDEALVKAILEEVTPERATVVPGGQQPTNGDSRPTGAETVEFAYLQLVLERLWSEARAQGVRRLTLAMLQRLPGGAEEIVRDHVRQAVERLSKEDHGVAADLFQYLVTPSGAKVAYTVADLAALTGAGRKQVERTLAELASGEARILRPVGVATPTGVEPGVEIYHDKLAAPILYWRSMFLERRQLERARVEAQESERRRRRRLALISLFAGSTVVILLLVLLVVLVSHKSAQVSDEKQTAESRGLAAAALGQLNQDPHLSLLLAMKAVEIEPTPEATEALRSALVASRVRQIIAERRETADRNDSISSIAMTRDGRALVSGSDKGILRIWRSDQAPPDQKSFRMAAGPYRLKGGVTSVQIAGHDPSFLAVSRQRAEVRAIGDGRSYGRLLPGPDAGHITEGEISADGTLVVISDATGRVRLWRPLTPALRRHQEIRGLPVGATSIALSPDGKRVVVFGRRGAAMWDTGSPGAPLTRLSDRAVESASFSPNGRLLITAAGYDAQLWDGRTGERELILEGHTRPVTSVAFNDDASRVATGSADQSVRLWNTKTGATKMVLGGHAGTVRAVAFGARGRRIATSSSDGAVRIWVPVSGRLVMALRGHDGAAESLHFGDGKLATTSSADGTGRIWEVDPGRSPTRINKGSVKASEVHSPMRDEVVSPHRRFKASVTRVGPVRIQDLQTGRRISLGFHGVTHDVSFSPDDETVVTAANDNTARVWSASTGRSLAVLGEHGGPVKQVSFSPHNNGRFVLDVSRDGCARLWLWGVAGGTLAARFPRDPCPLGYTQGGRSIKSGPGRPIKSARFDSTGRQIILTYTSKDVRRYVCQVCGGWKQLMSLATRRRTRDFTAAERRRFNVDR